MLKEIITTIMSKLRNKDSTNSGASTVVHVNGSNFDTEVLKSDKPVIVLFSAEWCPACQRQGPEFAKAAADHSGTHKFVKIDIDESRDLKRRYGVRAIPTLGFFKPGTTDGTMKLFTGYLTRAKLKAKIAEMLK
jgi:thioredoxin 1